MTTANTHAPLPNDDQMSDSNTTAVHTPTAVANDGEPLHQQHETKSEQDSEKAFGDLEKEAPDVAPRDVHGFVWFMTALAILAANFLFALDNTIVANVQPAIVQQFQSLDKLSWLSVAFFLSSAGTNLLWGDLYARFSAKWTFCSAFIVFAIGSAICGAAPQMDALIVGRAICGVGGAGMYIGSITLLTVMTSNAERPLYLSIVGVTWGLGTVLGPIIGGLFVQSNATWRWAFYLNLVVGGVCAPIYVFLLPTLNPRPGQTIKARAIQIDFLGVVLFCAFFTCLVMAISFGGTEYAWGSGQIIALFVVAFVLGCVFFAQQVFTITTSKEHRILPLHFLRSSTMCILFVQVVTAVTCVLIPIYFLPLYFQFVKGDDAILAGVRILPFIAFLVVFAVLSGWLIGRLGYYVPWFILAGVTCISGAALLYTVTDQTPLANVYGYQILIAVGAGATVQAAFPVAQAKVDPNDIPAAVGWCTLAQLGGPTIALSIANSIFLNGANTGVGNVLPNYSATDVSTIISDPGSPLLRQLVPDVQEHVIAAVVQAMSKVYILDIVAGIMTLLLILRFKPNDKIAG